ncbi:DUF2806 domain-containing protein [Salipiger sp. PrR002]|uniref:DUF2806 domain-containing protein n=1 Tax=Salipiger sp. PrR002 TaxID=2706489 RepID=UPI0013BCC156|nr:DUF2806 domain-containing protein [Salipiger sp. PrR002]NDW02421.1 DUF2806 domain-containing protein [Salipiger sp. PrR002]NDW59558.1 DUF2806 domain-containing protein [Salipiger sp. PrR004]
MADGESSGSGNWLTTLMDGGLPQLVAGPAGKAISRLIGTSADIPAAYIESLAQGIRDKTKARSDISAAIAERVADMATGDAEVMARAMDSMLARSYRAQTNKEAVAKVALEELQNAPPSPDSDGPSEDWMNKFERYAEDASSDDLRLMFGNLLAGEVRNPGGIFPATLHFVSMLDSETAKLIERVLPVCTSDGVALTELLDPKLSVPEEAFIEQSGFWTTGKNLNLCLNEDGYTVQVIDDGGYGIAFKGYPEAPIKYKAALLSRAGMNLASTVPHSFDYDSLVRLSHTMPTIKRVFLGSIRTTENGWSMVAPTEFDREGNKIE